MNYSHGTRAVDTLDRLVGAMQRLVLLCFIKTDAVGLREKDNVPSSSTGAEEKRRRSTRKESQFEGSSLSV